jgi:hypothetical protein
MQTQTIQQFSGLQTADPSEQMGIRVRTRVQSALTVISKFHAVPVQALPKFARYEISEAAVRR